MLPGTLHSPYELTLLWDVLIPLPGAETNTVGLLTNSHLTAEWYAGGQIPPAYHSAVKKTNPTLTRGKNEYRTDH